MGGTVCTRVFAPSVHGCAGRAQPATAEARIVGWKDEGPDSSRPARAKYPDHLEDGGARGRMRRVFAYGGRAVLRDIPEPALRPNHVLVETAFSAISAGTEGYIVRGSGDPTFVNHEYPDPTDVGVQYRDPQIEY